MPKMYWCSKCKKFPDGIVEFCNGFVREVRRWDGKKYELVDADSSGWEQECETCDESLLAVEKPGVPPEEA